MLCHQCGSPVSTEDTTCPNCGATLNKSAKKRTSSLKTRNLSKFTTQIRAVTDEDKPLVDLQTVLSGRFLIEEVLGKGQMGQVFEGKDKETGQKVAIKVFDPKLFPTNKDLNTFKTHTNTTANITQDNLVSILGCGVLSKKPWVATSFVEGLSLAKVQQLRQTKKEHFTRDEIGELLDHIVPALDVLGSKHAHGYLTPSNIYVWSESYLISDQAVMNGLPAGAWRTVRKDDPYLAPELGSKTTKLDARQDVYSLGAILSFLCFDRPTVPAASEIDEDLKALADVCRQATNTDPRRRHKSLMAFKEAADSALRPSSPPPPPMAVGVGLEEVSSPPPVPTGLEEQSSSVPPPPPMAPPGVEPVAENKEATQVLGDDEVDIISEDAAPKTTKTTKKTSGSKSATKGKTRRKNKRPMPKDEEVAATAISGSGESNKEEPAAEDIATIEINRDAPELGDLLPTNDFERDKIPPPRQPKLERENTKTAVEPKPSTKSGKDDDKGGIPPWAIILGILAVVLVGVVIASSSGNKKKVTITDEEPVAKKDVKQDDTPKTDVKADTKTDTKTDENKTTEVAAKEANTKVVAAKDSALTASNALAKKNEKADDKTDTKTDATKVAVNTTKTDPKTKTDGAKATKTDAKTDTKTDGGAKAKTDGAKGDAAKAAGTNCPRGMVLVKSKTAGNLCIDRYEYPGAGRPKTNVTWFQAVKLCSGRGKRLCSLSEWRRSCGSRYPGSSKWNPDRCNTQDEDEVERELTSVGKFKRCRSRSGAYDMTGNAHEWVAEKLIAGGGFDSGPSVAKCSYASRKSPSSKASYIGFRCCADPK